VWGQSAGGYLAAMTGASNGDKQFDVGDNLDQSSDVQGLVDQFGPSDLSQLAADYDQAAQDANHVAGNSAAQWVYGQGTTKSIKDDSPHVQAAPAAAHCRPVRAAATCGTLPVLRSAPHGAMAPHQPGCMRQPGLYPGSFHCWLAAAVQVVMVSWPPGAVRHLLAATLVMVPRAGSNRHCWARLPSQSHTTTPAPSPVSPLLAVDMHLPNAENRWPSMIHRCARFPSPPHIHMPEWGCRCRSGWSSHPHRTRRR
jgi:hypothetical protein